VHTHKGNKTDPTLDERVTVPRAAYPTILERIDAGESQEQVAADFGVTKQQVSKIVAKEKAKQEIQRKPLAHV